VSILERVGPCFGIGGGRSLLECLSVKISASYSTWLYAAGVVAFHRSGSKILGVLPQPILGGCCLGLDDAQDDTSWDADRRSRFCLKEP
jgi:hypothetical protein